MQSFPEVQVAAVVVAERERILAVHNQRWGKFTIPMTKRRKWQDPQIALGAREEEWEDAAFRAAVEVLGKSLPSTMHLAELIQPLRNYGQSDSDGLWKVYEFQVFGLTVAEGTSFTPGMVAEWWTPSDFSSEVQPGTSDRRPTSDTARYLINHLRLHGRLPPW